MTVFRVTQTHRIIPESYQVPSKRFRKGLQLENEVIIESYDKEVNEQRLGVFFYDWIKWCSIHALSCGWI